MNDKLFSRLNKSMKTNSKNKLHNVRDSKKGQVTIFIILGIIIIFIVGLAIYWQTSLNKVSPPVKKLVVAEELQPIQAYVTDCLSVISKEALIRVGQSGGYIDIPNGLHIDPIKTYDSDGLLFEPQVMPYWYYMKSSTGQLYTRNPPLCNNGVKCVLPYNGQDSIEEQLNKFIESHMAQCLNDFEPFKDKFTITSEKMVADSVITQSTVNFKLDYPLTINYIGSNTVGNIPYFYTEQDIKFKEIYQFAQDIRDAEANYTFLERNTLNLITAYSGIDSSKLPPMSGLEMFVNGKKYWIRSEVKDKLMSDILPYTMLLQIVNAGNAKQIITTTTDPALVSFEQGLYNNMMIKVSEKNTYFDLNANLYYPSGSDIYFRIGNGEIIKPDNFGAGNNILLQMIGYAMNNYGFKYDLTYPVIVKISDPDAFNGEGYTFTYAMQANIRQNVPINENTTRINAIDVPSVDMDDPILRVNRTITIDTTDKYTKEPLSGVVINYRCGYEISLGETVMKNGKAIFQDKLPFCQTGGEIIYEKAGYMGSAINYSNTDGNDPKNFHLELWPLQEKQIKVYKRTISDINSIRNVGAGGVVLYATAYSNLTDNETVLVNIARIKDDPRETDVPLVGFSVVKRDDAIIKTVTLQDQRDYINSLFTDGSINESVRDDMINELNYVNDTPQQTVTDSNLNYTMDFVPGQYTFDAFMMYGGTINIPEENTPLCVGKEIMGICVGVTKEMNYPEQNLSGWISGGADINFTLTENDVYNNNTLVFFVAEIPLPTSWNDFENSPSIDDYQIDKLSFLHPIVQ
jgi:hypothetical protein